MLAVQLSVDVPDLSDLPMWAVVPAAIAGWYLLTAAVMRVTWPKGSAGSGHMLAVWFGLPAKAVVLAVWSALSLLTLGLLSPPWRVLKGTDADDRQFLDIGCCILTFAFVFLGAILYSLFACGVPFR